MDLRGYLDALRRSWILIAIFALVGLAAGAMLLLTSKPVYSSTVTFYVSTPLAKDANVESAGSYAQERVNSYVQLMSSEVVADRVVEDSGLDIEPTDLMGEISATAELNTVLVTATVNDQSADRSLALAESLGNVFPALTDELDNQQAAADAARGAPVVVVKVVSGPTLNPTPVSPRPTINLGGGLVVGLMFGVVVAILRRMLDTRVSTEDDVAALTPRPLLGRIPFDKSVDVSPLIVGDQAATRRAEAFKQLRTNLRFINLAAKGNVIAITSAMRAEGKSSTSANLAIAMAEAGDRVLLIEADLRRPRVAAMLNVSGKFGLTDMIVDGVELSRAAFQWGDLSLDVIPAGTQAPNPAELLGSPQLHAIITSAKRDYDHVILDCAPILPVTDGALASTLADAVVIVVHHGVTKRASVAATIQSLAAVKAPLVGVLFSMQKSNLASRDPYTVEAYTADVIDAGALSEAPISAREEPQPPEHHSRHARNTENATDPAPAATDVDEPSLDTGDSSDPEVNDPSPDREDSSDPEVTHPSPDPEDSSVPDVNDPSAVSGPSGDTENPTAPEKASRGAAAKGSDRASASRQGSAKTSTKTAEPSPSAPTASQKARVAGTDRPMPRAKRTKSRSGSRK